MLKFFGLHNKLAASSFDAMVSAEASRLSLFHFTHKQLQLQDKGRRAGPYNKILTTLININGAKFPFIFNPIKGQSELLYTQHDQVRVSARGDVRDPVAGKVGQLRVSLVRGAHMDRQLSAESDASRMRISGTLIDVANVESETCP